MHPAATQKVPEALATDAGQGHPWLPEGPMAPGGTLWSRRADVWRAELSFRAINAGLERPEVFLLKSIIQTDTQTVPGEPRTEGTAGRLEAVPRVPRSDPQRPVSWGRRAGEAQPPGNAPHSFPSRDQSSRRPGHW